MGLWVGVMEGADDVAEGVEAGDDVGGEVAAGVEVVVVLAVEDEDVV